MKEEKVQWSLMTAELSLAVSTLVNWALLGQSLKTWE